MAHSSSPTGGTEVRGMRRAQNSDWDSGGGGKRHISASLFGKHGVNLAQNLGVWFWGPEPKFKRGLVVVKEFVRASKLRGRRKTLSKKCRRRMNSPKNTVSPKINGPSPLESFWHIVGHPGCGWHGPQRWNGPCRLALNLRGAGMEL